jgi:phosphatidylserine/phosphatidylglycerophosphate/cardiolipin synthase-like enzyme
VAASIVSASKSVDVAITSLSLPIITNALIRAKDRGARIRVVLEGDYLAANRPNPQALIDAGISVIGDPEHQEMGNNFIVIDNKQVWTGSMTFTAAGVYHGYNNLVNIHSEELAQNYTKEFEEMFTSGQFGPNVVPDTPNPVVDIQGSQIESMFLPDDLFAARLGELLNNARTSIHFSALSFASQEFGDLIRKKAADGVTVSGVIDDFELDPANVSQYELFKQAGLDVKLGSPDIILLSNFIIIDKSVVVVGTYDFSKKAELVTDGNVLIIHNEAIAGKYFDDYQIIQSTAQK